MSPALAAMLAAAADIDSTNNAKVTLRRDLLDSDFSDLWIVGDYSDKNGEKNGGYIAIKLIAALSTGGFVVQTKDKGKATYSFEFTAHSSLTDQNTVPVDIYVQSGTAETTSNTGDGT
nr:MAG TPA: major tail protein [Caudoviricetes sp.]